MSNSKDVVCVTGASGCIGSWIVHLLLDRGYSVHATVRNIKDEKETKHLEAFPGAQTRLRLYQIDLLDYDSIHKAVEGCHGVFHVASPCTTDKVQDPQRELLDPAIEGTINVLTAAKEHGVRRVVITSSVSAMHPSPSWPHDVAISEDCWTDIEYCKQKELWYPLSKTLAEKAAWEFSREKELDVVVVNPGTVMGNIVSPVLNGSMMLLLRLLQGSTETYDDFYIGAVHFKDVALAHIMVYENPSAAGRHICLEAISYFGSDFAPKLSQLYPQYKVPSLGKDTEPGVLKTKNAAKKLMELGLQFIPLEQIIIDAVECLKTMGFSW